MSSSIPGSPPAGDLSRYKFEQTKISGAHQRMTRDGKTSNTPQTLPGVFREEGVLPVCYRQFMALDSK